jgi:hypothetical protein
MDLNKSILSDVKEAVGLSTEPTLFDTEILMHINSAVAKLSQNDISFPIVVNELTTWLEIQDPEQVEGNKLFQMVPLFVSLSVKILFDPPPPSSVQYHVSNVDQILWRLKIAYEKPYIKDVGDSYE